VRPTRLKKPQRLCIFCQGIGLSKEHIWSEWTRDLIGHSSASRHRNITKFAANGRVDQRRTNGGLDTAKLLVVCRTCNSGWMGGLDNAVKAFGNALLTGNPTRLDATNQMVLSRWLIMKMMVTEHTNVREVPVVTTQSDRTRIKEGNWPVDHQWRVWIAGQLPGAKSRSHVRHYLPTKRSFDAVARNLGILESIPDGNVLDTQFFVLRIGRLIVVATCNDWRDKFTLVEGTRVVQQLFQLTANSIEWPLFDNLSERTIASLEASAKPFFGN
jgi:hypothetical protein